MSSILVFYFSKFNYKELQKYALLCKLQLMCKSVQQCVFAITSSSIHKANTLLYFRTSFTALST